MICYSLKSYCRPTREVRSVKQAEQPPVNVNKWTCDGLVERFWQDIGNFTEMLLLDTCRRWRRRLATNVTTAVNYITRLGLLLRIACTFHCHKWLTTIGDDGKRTAGNTLIPMQLACRQISGVWRHRWWVLYIPIYSILFQSRSMPRGSHAAKYSSLPSCHIFYHLALVTLGPIG